MQLAPTAYSEEVVQILALDGNGNRLMPLASGRCSSDEACRLLEQKTAKDLFPDSRRPEAALSGLWLYFSCRDASHSLLQQIQTVDGRFWHGIMHRQESDAGNAAYWFRRAGGHPVFPMLAEEAAAISVRIPQAGASFGAAWDPFVFIDFCARRR